MIFVEDSFDSYQNLIPGKTLCGQLPEKQAASICR